MKTLGSLKELADVIARYRERRAMITFHSVGDTDALSSAFILSKLFRSCTIATPDRITSNSRRMLRDNGYNLDTIATAFDLEAELIVLVDVNNFEGCAMFAEYLETTKSQILIIDHHAPIPITAENVTAFNDETHNSAASIIFDLMEMIGERLNEHEARLLLMGIISDSAEFKNSTPKTFTQIGKLLQIGNTDYPSLLEQMFIEPDPRTRERSIRDLFGAKVLIGKGLLILYGSTLGPANIAADNAIRVGADLAIFRSEHGNEVSLSARLKPPADRRYNLHLGKIMKRLSTIINGTGGGHACAAGAYGTRKDAGDRFIEEFIKVVLEHV